MLCCTSTFKHMAWNLTRLSTEGLGPRHGEVRRAHQMLIAALVLTDSNTTSSESLSTRISAGTAVTFTICCVYVQFGLALLKPPISIYSVFDWLSLQVVFESVNTEKIRLAQKNIGTSFVQFS